MIDCKCSFATTLITEEYSCEMAQLVTRRAGPDIACSTEQGSDRCQQVYADLKAIGLPAFGAEDDLLKTPASVYGKIQYGGLLGLAKTISSNDKIEAVDNIYQLLEQVMERYETYDNIPHQELVSSMLKIKIKRKKKSIN